MHIPKQFKESKVDVLQKFMREYSLCTLITNAANGVNANHIPMYVIEQPAPLATKVKPLFIRSGRYRSSHRLHG